MGDPPRPPFVRGRGRVGRLAVDWRGFDSRRRVAVATAPAPLVRGRACGQACGDWRERGFVGVRPSRRAAVHLRLLNCCCRPVLRGRARPAAGGGRRGGITSGRHLRRLGCRRLGGPLAGDGYPGNGDELPGGGASGARRGLTIGSDIGGAAFALAFKRSRAVLAALRTSSL